VKQILQNKNIIFSVLLFHWSARPAALQALMVRNYGFGLQCMALYKTSTCVLTFDWFD